MKHKKIFITSLVLAVICTAAFFIVDIVMKFNFLSFRISTWIIGGMGILQLLLIMFFEAFVKDFQAKTFTIPLHATYAVIAVAMNYVTYYAGNYDTYRVIYCIGTYLGCLIVSAVFIVLNFVYKPKPVRINPRNLPKK